MRHLRLVHLSVAVFLAVSLTACGGDGLKGFRTDTTPLSITSTTILEPANGTDTNTLFESADLIDFEIPIAGGCGGPYVLSILSGELPDGVGLADSVTVPGSNVHALRGSILEAGTFSFRLQVVDKSCDPFLSTFADFTWDVVVGDLKIVGATSQGNSVFYPKGTYVKNGVILNPDYDALKSAVYNSFVVIDITVAGGIEPYVLQIVDDPSNPEDASLPTGTLIATATTSIIGSPTPPASQLVTPFVFTVEAADSQGRTVRQTLQWQIDTPPIIIANASMPEGKCGIAYAETIVIVDGVPPFTFELVQSDVARDGAGDPVVDYSVFPAVPTPATAGQRVTNANYPAAGLLGPDYRSFAVPPEGMYIGDVTTSYSSTGTLSGIPRRRGQFHVNFHVASTTLANVQGQQQWRTYEFSCVDSEPPIAPKADFSQDPAYTVQGAFSAVQPYADIPEAQFGVPYNPDAATHPASGFLFLARGGVSKDGLSDAPHASQVVDKQGLLDTQENPGAYDWTMDPNPAGDGDVYSAMPASTTLDGWLGVFRVVDPTLLVKQANQALEVQVSDQQLPTPHTETRRVNFTVGPETVIITESTSSANPGYLGGPSMNDMAQTVKVVVPSSSGITVRGLVADDLSKNTVVPATAGAGTSVASLLTDVDLLTVSTTPTGWWDDSCGLNPSGAREFQHADPNKYYYYAYALYNYYPWSPNTTCIELPACTSSVVTANPANGIYTNGGKLYGFSSAKYFGVFVVRSDGSIYVPAAFDRSTYNSFGDGMFVAYGTKHNAISRTPQITVSPDGRWAAMKLKATETNFLETANNTPIVLFSLTGERPFSGAPYKIVGTGAGGTAASGTYLYATGMAMTARHLYYICGNFAGTSYSDSNASNGAWHGHYIYRYEFADPAGTPTASASTGALLASAVADVNWRNTTNNPMQTPFQKWDPGTQSVAVTDYGAGTTSVTLPNSPYYYDDYGTDGSNMMSFQCSRVPFRVSKNGKAIAILAGTDPGAVTLSTDLQNHHVWVDQDGAGVRRLSTAKRHCIAGAGRGYALTKGPDYYPLFRTACGPTTGLEISDDATKVAVVVNRYNTTTYIYGYYYSSSSYSSTTANNWITAREDVIAYRTTNDWATATEIQVTGDDAFTASRTFAGASGSNSSHLWRFGALTFTADNLGLVFWGGMSSYYGPWISGGNPGSYYTYYAPQNQCGTMYGCNLASAGPGTSGVTVTSLILASDGGAAECTSSAGYVSHDATAASKNYNPTLPTGTYSAIFGVVKPVAGFISKNRNFLYMVNNGGITSSESTANRLVAVNIRSVTTSQNIAGKTDFRGFAVGGASNWPKQRGFIPEYLYMGGYYGISLGYVYGGHTGVGGSPMMGNNGTVYWHCPFQQYGPGNYQTSGANYGGPVNSVYYSYNYQYGSEVFAFAADVGGNPVKVTNFNSDTSQRGIRALELSKSGEDVAFVYDTSYYYYPYYNAEYMYMVRGVKFDGSGALVGTPIRTPLESASGRASESMSFHSAGDKIYYGFTAGAANENARQLVQASHNSTLNTVSKLVSGSFARYQVLHAGR